MARKYKGNYTAETLRIVNTPPEQVRRMSAKDKATYLRAFNWVNAEERRIADAAKAARAAKTPRTVKQVVKWLNLSRKQSAEDRVARQVAAEAKAAERAAIKAKMDNAAASRETPSDPPTEKKKDGVIGFLFRPQFPMAFQSIGFAVGLFVQIFAQIFISIGLLPPDHPARKLSSAKSFPLKGLLGEARNNLVPLRALWSGVASGMPKNVRILAVKQYVLFASTVGMMIAVAVSTAGLMMSTMFNVAHAFAQTVNQGPGIGPNTATAAGTDLASGLIDSIFSTSDNGSIVMSGLGDMFRMFNSMILVFAGIIVLWIIISSVAETARTGVPFGKQFNHVWAPIRLIVALGLLVPLGSGLNSGQEIVVGLTKWGSQQASSIWSTFADKMIVSTTNNGQVSGGLENVPITLNDYRGVADNLFDVLLCKDLYNGYNPSSPIADPSVAAGGGTAVSTPATNANINVAASTNGISASELNPQSLSQVTKYSWQNTASNVNCGSLNINTPNQAAITNATQNLPKDASGNTQVPADLQASITLLNGQTATANSFISQADGLAQQVAAAAGTWVQSGGAIDTFPDPDSYFSQYQGYVTSYMNSQANSLRSAFQNYNNNFATSMQADAKANGWVSSPMWLNKIAQQNGNVMDTAQVTPTVTPPDTSSLGETAGDAWNVAQEYMGKAEPTSLATHTSSLDTISNQMSATLLQIVAPSPNPLGTMSSYGREMSRIGVELISPPGMVDCIENPFKTQCDWVLREGLYNAKVNDPTNIPQWQNLISAQKSGTVSPDQLEATYKNLTMGSNGGSILPSGKKLKTISAMATIAQSSTSAHALLYPVGMVLLTFGVTDGYILPLIPFARFMLGVLGWMIMLFEAMLGIQLLALSLLKTDGEGFGTQQFNTGVTMILAVMLRPTLMIFGEILGLMAFNGIMRVSSFVFLPTLMNLSNGNGNAAMSVLDSAIYIVFYGTFVYTLANSAFKLIDILPNYVMSWIGSRQESRVDDASMVQQQTSQYMQTMAYGMGSVGRGAGAGAAGKGTYENWAQNQQAQQTASADSLFAQSGKGGTPPVQPGGSPKVNHTASSGPTGTQVGGKPTSKTTDNS